MKSFKQYLKTLNEDSRTARFFKLTDPRVLVFVEKIKSPFRLRTYLLSFKNRDIEDLIQTVTEIKNQCLRFAIFVKESKPDFIFVWNGDVLHYQVLKGIDSEKSKNPSIELPSYKLVELYRQEDMLWDEISSDIEDWCWTGIFDLKTGEIDSTLTQPELRNMDKSVHYKALFGI